jgi:hypothetical protein
MLCPYCQTRIADEADECKHCGARVGVGPDLNETKPCPFCAEKIRADAVKCRFCGEFLRDTAAAAVMASQGDLGVMERGSATSLQGLKAYVTLCSTGKIESGKLLFQGTLLSLKKMFSTIELFDLRTVTGLEHRKENLLVHAGKSDFVINFRRGWKESEPCKQIFATLVRATLPPWQPDHRMAIVAGIAAGAGVTILLLSLLLFRLMTFANAIALLLGLAVLFLAPVRGFLDRTSDLTAKKSFTWFVAGGSAMAFLCMVLAIGMWASDSTEERSTEVVPEEAKPIRSDQVARPSTTSPRPKAVATETAEDAAVKATEQEKKAVVALTADEQKRMAVATLMTRLEELANQKGKSIDETREAAKNLEAVVPLVSNALQLPQAVRDIWPTLDDALADAPEPPVSQPKPEKPQFEKPEYTGAVPLSGTFKASYSGGFFEKDGIVMTSGGKHIVVLGADITLGALFFASHITGYGTKKDNTVTLDIGRSGREAAVYEYCDKETYLDDQREYKATVKIAREQYNEELKAYKQVVAEESRLAKEHATIAKTQRKALLALPGLAKKAIKAMGAL